MKRKNIESYLLAGLKAPTGLLENWKKTYGTDFVPSESARIMYNLISG